MGETVSRSEAGDLEIYYKISSAVPIKRVTLVKNCRDYIALQCRSELILDYRQETPTDHYHIRAELVDGRFGWTSPIWVEE